MSFNDWQESWQKQPVAAEPGAATMVATIERVRAGARSFDRTILWRDLREGVAAIGVAGVFGLVACAKTIEGARAWDAWLAAALPLGVAGFLFADRWRAQRRRPKGAASVLSEIDHALAELRHQHWLLKNVLWWYLLPLAASGALITGQAVVMASPSPGVRAALAAVVLAIISGVSYPLWRLNRRLATNELAPRIAQLERERRELAEI